MAAYCQVYGVIHFMSPAGWLPLHRDQLRAQRSVTSMGKHYLTFFTSRYAYSGQWPAPSRTRYTHRLNAENNSGGRNVRRTSGFPRRNPTDKRWLEMNPFASRRRRTTVPFNDLSFSAASRRVASPAAALCTVTEFYGRFHLMPYILDQTPRNRRGRIYSCCRYKVIYYTLPIFGMEVRLNAQFKGLHATIILQKK